MKVHKLYVEAVVCSGHVYVWNAVRLTLRGSGRRRWRLCPISAQKDSTFHSAGSMKEKPAAARITGSFSTTRTSSLITALKLSPPRQVCSDLFSHQPLLCGLESVRWRQKEVVRRLLLLFNFHCALTVIEPAAGSWETSCCFIKRFPALVWRLKPRVCSRRETSAHQWSKIGGMCCCECTSLHFVYAFTFLPKYLMLSYKKKKKICDGIRHFLSAVIAP